ncbi:MAG TPA: cation:proton antiporter [Actinospica sp.]|jgi:Kef-type K+ transport system membrane component KefB|nr:cation:proton antiporter [Actinospica sp.]
MAIPPEAARDGAQPPSRPGRAPAAYILTVLIPVLAALLLVRYGTAHPLRAQTPGAVPPALSDQFGQVLKTGAVILAAAGLLGLAARAARQSVVVGEILAGLLLGPSVLGAVAPGVEHSLFPASLNPVLNDLAQLGVVFFMFHIGVELPLTMLRRVGSAAVSLGHAAIAVPFLLGTLLALGLRGRYQPADVRTVPFVLFVALSVSVTAFPVLARILSDRGMTGARLGTLALAAAGVGDATAWCALSLVVAEVRNGSPVGVLRTVGEVLAFAAVLWFAVRPLLAWAARELERRYSGSLPGGVLIACFVLLCAVATNDFGVHPIFGAFLAGMVMPRSSRTVADFAVKSEGLTLWLLLPFFFTAVGLQTRLQSVFGATAAWALLAVLAVAVLGKVGGAYLAARAAGENRRDALGLGVMMNCRGLTELVVLDVGLSLGVISTALFSVLVVMTLLTTVATDPLLRLLRLDRAAKPPGGVPRPAVVAAKGRNR